MLISFGGAANRKISMLKMALRRNKIHPACSLQHVYSAFMPFAFFFYKQDEKNKLDETYWRQISLYKEGELFRRYSDLFPAFKPITKLCINEREVIRPFSIF